MSFGELLIVAIVVLIVITPDDIPIVISKLKQIKCFLDKLKSDIFGTFDVHNFEKQDISDPEEINFYLQKIIDLGGNYDGEYSVDKLRKKYYELLQNSDSKRKDSANK